MQRPNFQETPPLAGRYEDSDELEQKRLKHIEALTEELNLNRKRYEKLLSDHAEEKRQWMNYIKQLEGEREKMSPI
jgi:coenzyme F420-reducing hydrogenase delta subunit